MTDWTRRLAGPKSVTEARQVADMHQPVRCTHCGGVYDLGTVTVTARYTDCSMWKSPCCDLTVDDRGETGWKSRGDYTRIDKNAPAGDYYDAFGIRHAD
jgi:hypothetical protein